MAYSTSTPPILMVPSIGGQPAIWVYKSADAHGTVDGTDYFTNGGDLGMKANDVVIVIDTATPTCTVHTVNAVDADGNATLNPATLA